MEVPIKIEHLKLCKKGSTESFDAYIQRYRTLASRMRDTPDLKEIVRICAINAGSAAWFLTSAACDTFEALFDRILIYEELVRAGGIGKSQAGASVHVVDDAYATNDYNNRARDRNDKPRYNKNGGNAASSGEQSRRQWRDPKDYSFDLKDTERWFELMLKEGEITWG